MTPERWQYLSDKLGEAVESDNPRACAAGDKDLERLIDAHQRSGKWLDPPVRDGLLGRTLVGRYSITAVLGRGGAGVVYLASDINVNGRSVVVKLLHDFWSSEDWMRRKFRDEAAALAKLDHPGIVSLLDAGELEDGRLYLVMPYRDGRTLREALSEGHADTLDAARWIREAGEAVSYAHDHGILHRDLKPENLLLVARDGRESPMLLDFGIAHCGDPSTASRTTTHLMGSAFYMAPEHLLARPERASDLYSLAIIAWELLTGQHPFAADSPFALPGVQRQGVGDSFFRLRPDLGLAAGRLLGRALEFDPKRRPMPVKAFTAELADAIAATGVDLRIARLWAVRRSRRWMLAGGSLTLAGAAAAGWLVRDRARQLTPQERVIQYRGGRYAEENGFRREMDMYGEFCQERGKAGIRATRFFSKSQGIAMRPLTASQKRAAFHGGWRLQAALRPEMGVIGVLLDTGSFAPRFEISLENVPGGIEAMAVKQVRTGQAGPTILLENVKAGS